MTHNQSAPSTTKPAQCKKRKLGRLSEDDFHEEVRLLLQFQEPGGVLDSLHVVQDEIKRDFLVVSGVVFVAVLISARVFGRDIKLKFAQPCDRHENYVQHQAIPNYTRRRTEGTNSIDSPGGRSGDVRLGRAQQQTDGKG